MSHLVVQARPMWQVVLIRLGIGLLLLLVAWGLYEYGRYQGGFHQQQAKLIQLQQQEENAALRRENQQIHEQNVILTRGAKIDREAYRQLEARVNGLQDELVELKSELDFYRGIVSPGDANHSLEIQRFELQAAGEQRYRYTLVLTQVLDNSNWAQGNVEFRVQGNENGEAKTYTLAQLSEHEGHLSFRYRYFQFFEGELALPEGFEPSKVELEVKPRGRVHRSFSQSFDWVAQES